MATVSRALHSLVSSGCSVLLEQGRLCAQWLGPTSSNELPDPDHHLDIPAIAVRGRERPVHDVDGCSASQARRAGSGVEELGRVQVVSGSSSNACSHGEAQRWARQGRWSSRLAIGRATAVAALGAPVDVAGVCRSNFCSVIRQQMRLARQRHRTSQHSPVGEDSTVRADVLVVTMMILIDIA
nr:hypothetical protein CFP56_02677 [Quercus suber]